jgi:hypothetical protein
MIIFDKPYAEYLRYQTPLLAAIAAAGLVRLALSIAETPDAQVKYVSMTVVYFAGIAYYGLSVGRSGFGTYRHLLPLILDQSLVFHAIAILGITLSANGLPNVFDTPEFRGPGGSATSAALPHALSHLFIGTTLGTLVGWGLGSLLMLTLGRRPDPRAVSTRV